MMLCCQNVSADWIFGNILLSTMVCGTYFAEPDTTLVFNIFYEIFGGGTRLAMPKTILRTGLIVIEAWFRGYRGSPGLGGLRASGFCDMARIDGP